MQKHFSTEEIKRFRDHALSPIELVNWYDHIAVCDACRQRASQMTQAPAAMSSLISGLEAESARQIDHLLYEQIEAYVDNHLKEVERQAVNSHLLECAECEDRVKELQTFKAEITRADSKKTPVKKTRFWPAFPALGWGRPLRWSIQLAATAGLIFLCVWLATLPLRQQVAGLQAERQQLQQENQALQKEFLAAKDRLNELEAEMAKAPSLNREPLPGNSAPPVVALNDAGRQIGIDQSGQLVGLETLPAAAQEEAKKALMAQQLDTPPGLQEVVSGSGSVVRGSSPGVAFALISPVGTLTETDRPEFTWKALNGATGYSVTVYDAGFNPVATSDLLTASRWVIAVPLKRDQVYSWQVTARKDGNLIKSPTTPAPEAKFKVLGAATVGELQKARQLYGNSHFLLGILYTKYGLLDAAEREFRALVASNPQSAVAKQLLRRVESLKLPKAAQAK